MAQEILWLPVPKERKKEAKPVIDSSIRATLEGVVGILIFILVQFKFVPTDKLHYLSVIALTGRIFWVWNSFRLKNGYVKTLFGRKVNIKDYNSKNLMIRNYAQRQAINAPIQGTAADVIKRAMIKIYSFRSKNEFTNTKLLLQVHDELVFETSETNLEIIKNLIVKIMISAHSPIIKLDVPLEVSFGEGKNWEEAH